MSGLKFSNGEKIDAEAVKYSIDRITNDQGQGRPGRPARLARPGGDQGRRHGRLPPRARRTRPSRSSWPHPRCRSSPPATTPRTSIRDDGKVTGSGPYVLDSYEPGKKAELTKNPSYKGFADRKNDAVTIRYFEDSTPMVKALKAKEIDATYRGLTAEEVVGLEDNKEDNNGLQIVESVGADIRFLVFNPKDPAAGKLPVRQAIAQLVDRDALVAKVYRGTAEPLYSMIPKGIAGHATSFFDTYGDPDVAKARQILTGAGITEPVEHDPLVHHGPLRILHRPRVRRAEAPAGGVRPLPDHAEERAVEVLPGRLQQGRVPGLRACPSDDGIPTRTREAQRSSLLEAPASRTITSPSQLDPPISG